MELMQTKVLVVGFVTPLQPSLLDGTHIRIVQFHVHAVFASDGRLALEVIPHFGLVSPFTLSQLRGIGIERCQGIRMVEREGGQVVDETRRAQSAALTAERHVVRPFGLYQEAQSFLRIGTPPSGMR